MKNFAVYLSAIVLAGVLSAAGVLAFSDSEDNAFADAAPGDFAGIEIDGLIYTLTSEGKASVTGYTGSPADVVIPSSVEYESESYSVTSVASKAFYQCASLKSADLGSVTSVGSSAFAYCKNLGSVDLGDSMKTISSYAFNRCIKLAEIATADSAGTLSAIGNYSFNQCNKISEISIPMGIKTVYSKAFSMTFKDLDGSVLPVSADSLRGFTYANYDGDLVRVLDIVPGTEFPIGSLVYTVTSVDPYKAEVSGYIGSIKAAYVPETVFFEGIEFKVTSIGEKAFYKCKALKTVEAPFVTYIGKNAFAVCSNLESVYLEKVKTIDQWAFSYCSKLSDIHFGTALTIIKASAFYKCYSITYAELPDSLKTISPSAFKDCSGLISVQFGSSLKSVSPTAFAGITFMESNVVVSDADSLRGKLFFQSGDPDSRILKCLVDYKFLLMNTVSGDDSSINGWYYAQATSPVEALCIALDSAGIKYEGFDYDTESVYFNSSQTISDWSFGDWESDGTYFGAQMAVWNYNEEDGWHLGDSFGAPCGAYQPAHKSGAIDTVFILSHENYLDVDGPAAAEMGISNEGVYPAAADYDLVYDGKTGGYADADAAMIAWYRAIVASYGYVIPDLEDYGISLAEGSDYDDAEIAAYDWMGDINIPAYSAVPGWNIDNAQYGYAQLAPQNYMAAPEDLVFGPALYKFLLLNSVEGDDSSINGWYSGFGSSVIDAFCNAMDVAGIKHPGITNDMESVYFNSSRTISDWSFGEWKSDGTFFGAQMAVWNYNEEDGWHLGDSFGAPCGKYQPAHKSDLPDKIFILSHENYLDVDGPVAAVLGIDNSGVYPAAADYDLVYDGETGGYGDADTALIAWYRTMVATYTFPDVEDFGISLAEGSTEYKDVSDASNEWMLNIDVTAYTAVPGWNIDNAQYGYAQLAPRDYAASPEDLEFGPNAFAFLLLNSVPGDDSTINGWYIGIGSSVIDAFCNAMDGAGISHEGITNDMKSVYFNSSKTISDWSFGEWKSDGNYFGAQMAVWNYNEEDGWHLGNSFGEACGKYQPAHKSDLPDRIFILSHENYPDVDGPAAAAMGISNEGVYPAAADYDLVYDGKTGGYADADAALIAWYRTMVATYTFPDVEDFGISLAEGSTEYKDVSDASSEWMLNIDVTAYAAVPGWNIDNAQYGYAQLAPQDYAASPLDLVFGPTLTK